MDDDTKGEAISQGPPTTFLKPKYLQRELRIGPGMCYRLLKSGAIPAIRIGGVYRIHRSQLEGALRIHSDFR
jgi:excisionase family DNA binding protein